MEKSNLKFFFKKYWVFLLLSFFVLFLYVFSLEKNSRFIWDESRALVDMHRIWEQKLITFVGPISQDNLEMFPSLSYYMYLPGAILTQFDPLGPVYMAVLYGLLTWLILTSLIIKTLGTGFKSFLLSLFVATAYPMILVSRWAWNPNLIIFWLSLFIFSLSSKNPLIILLGGLSLGASLYHHYLAAFIVLPALLLLPICYQPDSKDRIKNIFLTFFGYLLSMIPFVLFEFKNHFFYNSVHFLSANNQSFLAFTSNGYLDRLWQALQIFSRMFVPNQNYLIILFLFSILLIYLNFQKDRLLRYAFLVFCLSFLLFGFIPVSYTHYQFAQVPLFCLFLIRFISLSKNILGKTMVAILVLNSLLTGSNLICSYTWEGDITAVRNVTEVILQDPEQKTNVAVLGSSDPNTTGQRYRDMVLIEGKTLEDSSHYPQSKVLYIVSTTANQDLIRQDPAWEMESFRGSIISHTWRVSDYPIYLFRFQK